MDEIYMTQRAGKLVVRLVIGGLLLFLVLVGYVACDSRQGRQDLKDSERQARRELVQSQRQGCERTKKDRRSNSQGWRTAQTARMRSVAKELGISMGEVALLIKKKPRPQDSPDLVAARRYDGIASDLERRSEINCKEAFP